MDKKQYAENLIKEYSEKEKELSKVDELKALDNKVKNFPTIFAYVFGVVGSLILGVGMCLGMKVIGGTTPLMVLGIIIGVVGICMVSATYPIFTRILAKRKNKYADEIIAKSNEILKSEEN